MAKCSVCGIQVSQYKGITLFLNNGKSIVFCSRKCKKNYKLKRRKLRWVTKLKKSA